MPPDSQPLAPDITIELIRPASGAKFEPGGFVSGIGWVSCSVHAAAMDIYFGQKRLCAAQLGLSAAEFTTLTGQQPPRIAHRDGGGTSAGFVFAGTLPADVAGAAGSFRFSVETAAGTFVRAVTPSEPAGPIAPIRAEIDVARVDERGIARISGWVLSLTSIERLYVKLGRGVTIEAQRHMPREDVAAQFTQTYPDVSGPGFLILHEISDEDLGLASIELVAVAAGNVTRVFTAKLERAAEIRRRAPEHLAELRNEEIHLSADGVVAVKGWAVCSSGPAVINVEVDDVLVGNCAPGETRADVGNRFPRIVPARQAGFRFVHKLGHAFEGDHIVRVSISGPSGEQKSVFEAVSTSASVPDHFLAHLPAPAVEAALPEAAEDDIRFFLDIPAVRDGTAIETVRGFMSLGGWAFARSKIERVEVFVDGVSQGRAHHGIRREDLQTAFPGYDAALAGFAMVIPPQVMKPGLHQVRLFIADADGNSREQCFAVQAEKPATGPGPWNLRSKLPQSEIDLQRAILQARHAATRWVIIMLCRRSGRDTMQSLQAAIEVTVESLRHQAYTDWSLVLLADESDAADLGQIIEVEHADLRDRVTVRPICADRPLCSHAAMAEYVAVLAPGDQLGEDALLEMSIECALKGDVDFIYSDESRIDPADGESRAFFKPDWSPELLLATNYIGRLWGTSRDLLRETGLQEGDLAAAGEYDAILRLTERAQTFVHVPKVLCASGRRTEPASTERRALRSALRRRGLRGDVVTGAIAGTYQIRRPIQETGLVSIIIPTNASKGLIEKAITSIRALTSWPAYEIICLDNIPRTGTAEQLHWKAWIAANADRVVEITSAFNWSRFNNRGARAARGEYVLFLNDDIEVTDPQWLHGLVEQAQRPEVGVVGPQLLYPDGRVQHAGVFLARRAARHAFRFYPRNEPGPFGLALTQRDVISVTGACMLMRRSVFDEMGGFDEAHAVVNNDLDFNLRVRRAGRSVIFVPSVSLIHHEMISRSKLVDSYHSRSFDREWGDLFLKGDPFFSPHFSTDYDDYLPDAEPVRMLSVGHPVVARDSVRKILAVKVDHIGDFVTAFPAFRRLKSLFPRAELIVLAAKASLSLADLEPAIDRVIEFNFFHARSEKGRRSGVQKELTELQRRLAPERFDLAIDLRRQPDTRPILQHTGARWTAGFESGYAHPWLDFAVEFEGDQAKQLKRDHVTDSILHLVDAVSANCEPDRTIIRDPVSHEAARSAVKPILLQHGFNAALLSAPMVCIHTGAGAVNKQWPGASFAGLIDLLVGECGVAVAIIGGPEEAADAEAVVKQLRRPEAVVNLVGKTKIRELPAVLRAADLYIGNDSGPKHIAAALGVPTIGIHSGSVDAGEWGPAGPRSLTIRRDMTCSPCYLAHAADCHRSLACLTGIRVGDVYRASRRMLAFATKSARVEQVWDHAAD